MTGWEVDRGNAVDLETRVFLAAPIGVCNRGRGGNLAVGGLNAMGGPRVLCSLLRIAPHTTDAWYVGQNNDVNISQLKN